MLFRILLLIMLLFPGMARAGDEPLAIGVEAYYPPFTFLDKSGSLVGFDVGIANALCAEMKRPCDVKAYSFEELPELLSSGTISLIVAGMGSTPQREETMDFSDRYYRSRSIYIGRPNAGLNIEDLAGKRIGAQEGTLQAEFLQKTWGEKSEIVLAPYETILGWLQEGRVDLVLLDGLPGYEFLKTPNGSAYEVLGEPLSADTGMSVARMAVRKGDKALLDAVNAAIASIRRNGVYDAINRAFFDYSIY